MAFLKDLNKSTPKQANKSEIDKEMLMEAPTVVPGLKTKDEAAKITKTHEEDKIDPLKVITNMELVKEPRTISLAAALTTQDGRAKTGNPTVHSA